MASWYEADAEARGNLRIEGMALAPQEVALFDMLPEEAVPLADCGGLTWNGCAGSCDPQRRLLP